MQIRQNLEFNATNCWAAAGVQDQRVMGLGDMKYTGWRGCGSLLLIGCLSLSSSFCSASWHLKFYIHCFLREINFKNTFPAHVKWVNPTSQINICFLLQSLERTQTHFYQVFRFTSGQGEIVRTDHKAGSFCIDHRPIGGQKQWRGGSGSKHGAYAPWWSPLSLEILTRPTASNMSRIKEKLDRSTAFTISVNNCISAQSTSS